MPSITISNKGQITLPAPLRHQLGLEPRGKIDIEVREGALVLRPARTIRSVRGVFGAARTDAKTQDWVAVRTKTERSVAEETIGEDR